MMVAERCCPTAPCLLLLLCIASCCLVHHTTSAAQQQAGQHSVIRSVSSDLSFDEHNRLATHALVYVGSTACLSRGLLSSFSSDRYTVAQVTGAAQDELFAPSSSRKWCQAACIERGVEGGLAGSIMPHKYYGNRQQFDKWFTETCTKVEVCFINYHSKSSTLASFRIGEEGQREPHLTAIRYGERHTQCFTSFLGQIFQVEDSATNTVLASVTIEHATVLSFGTSPPSDTRMEGYKSYEREVTDTLHSEWRRHLRVTRSFSPLGFQKGRLPNDVFASMGALYYNNQNNVVREEWKGRGVFCNWWETQILFLQVPWSLKTLYQGRLHQMVQDWAGVPVEQTVMYGLRQYTEGARLLTHVDVHETHAVSLIVNVAQGNLTEPWPVEVHDHQDRLHEVIMEPGDVVYYESAKCLHARNRPLTGPGAYYVNLFTHYKPIVEGEWWLQENPDGTPEPVMEVEGTCRLAPMGTSQIAGNGQLGLVTGVQCDDPRLGKHVSPSLHTATGAQDLIQWWKMTSPNRNIATPGDESTEARDDEF